MTKKCVAGKSSTTGYDTNGSGAGCVGCAVNSWSAEGATSCTPCTNNRVSAVGSTVITDCKCPEDHTGVEDGVSECTSTSFGS